MARINIIIALPLALAAAWFASAAVAAEPAASQPQAQSEAPTPALAGNAIQDISYTPLPAGRVQIKIKTARRPDAPGTFQTSKPARLAFDFFGARGELAQPSIKVNIGAVESVAAASTDERTRVVVNLSRPATYESQITDEGLVLIVESGEVLTAPTVAKKTTTRFAEPVVSDRQHTIEKVDFRRSREGGGSLIVNLSDPTVGIDIREQSGEIVLDFANSRLAAGQERRLDVVDFATPVQTVDVFQQGGAVRVVVAPQGRYEHLAYQSGNVFNLTVNPISEEADKRRKNELGYSGEKLSLNFQKISVRAALQVIADFTGLNFVTSDAVKGDITLRLQDVPWDQALDIILQTRGLAQRVKGNVVWVAPAAEIAAKERAELEASKQVSELEPLVSELIQVNYAKAADLAKLLKSIKAVDTGVQQSLFGSVSIAKIETEANTLLSPRGQVTVDERTNTLLIQDTSGKIREVRKLIADLDKPVRQVMIETRIVEAQDGFARSLGVKFGFQRITENALLGNKSGLGNVYSSGTLAGSEGLRTGGLGGVQSAAVNPDALNVNLPSPGAIITDDPAATYAIEIFKAGTGYANLISLEISALEAEGRGKIVANPRLITANQKEAHIEQGQERIFTTTVLGVGSVVTKKAVLGLTVTPQITPDDRVIMDVFITKDSFVSPLDPTIDTKQIKTQVLLDNGETVIIGGIYQQEIRDGVIKVPILGDIPLLGYLFRRTERSDQRTELLIFLTPRLISPALTVGAAEPPARG